MVIHHPARLHKGVYRGGTDKFEASFFELFCYGVGDWRSARRRAVVWYVVNNSFAADFAPKVRIY